MAKITVFDCGFTVVAERWSVKENSHSQLYHVFGYAVMVRISRTSAKENLLVEVFIEEGALPMDAFLGKLAGVWTVPLGDDVATRIERTIELYLKTKLQEDGKENDNTTG